MTKPNITGIIAEAKRSERERIIKLLESIEDYPPGWDYNDEIASVIALIKGENK